MAKNLLDQNQIKYNPNLEGERLQAAGEHELQVCGVLQLEGTYNGNTTTMDCLVTPDLDNEAIVSATDAEAVGAITRNRAETNQPILTNKHVVQKCKKKKRVRFSTEGEEPQPKEPAPGDASSNKKEAPEMPSTTSSNASATNNDMFARAYNNTIDPNRVSVQGVKSLGGHFACLCRGFEFYEVKKKILLLFFKKKMEILLHFLSFL